MRQPPLILIVDDNEANRDILARRLEVNGYQFAMAADGEEALEQARALLPDLILLDVMMPKLDGLEVCRRLKADKSLPFMPIILVTARSDSKDVVAGLDVGGDEYLTKPVDQAALVARVRSILRTKALHDQVLEQSQRLAAQSEELVIRTLTRCKTAEDNARSVARALVTAEAEGLKGHGLSRVPVYAAQAKVGKVDGFARPAVTKPKPSVLAIDVAHGFAYPALDLAVAELPTVARAQGVGPKLAGRIVNELKDKAGALPGAPAGVPLSAISQPGTASADAVSALQNLGFKPAVAASAVAHAQAELGEAAELNDLVRAALKRAAG